MINNVITNSLKDKPYMSLLCEFHNLEKIEINTIISPENKKEEKRLWAIFGKSKESNCLHCLQVGSSKNIISEIKGILRLMISKPEKIKISTAFHKDVYDFCTYMDKPSVKYRNLYKKYYDFSIYEIEVDIYLEGVDIKAYDKVNFAEVKFAFENKAILWNPAPATYGNKEQEIYKNYFKK